MRAADLVAACLCVAVAASAGGAAAKAPQQPQRAKSAPSCAAIAFRPLPGGGADGEATAGSYRSRFARFELRGTVQNGTAVNYYLVANGTRLAAASAKLPDAAESCAAQKKMPKPESAAASCTGDRFTVVIAHSAKERFALLYGHQGAGWQFCGAGAF